MKIALAAQMAEGNDLELFGQAEINRMGIVVKQVDVAEIFCVGVLHRRRKAEDVEITFGEFNAANQPRVFS